MAEREIIINTRDMVYSVIKRWRVLVLAAVIGGVLGAGYRMIPENSETVESGSEEDKEEAFAEQLSAIEKQIEDKEKQIESNQEKIRADEQTTARREEAILYRKEGITAAKRLINAYEKLLSDAEERLKTAENAQQGEILQAMADAYAGIRDQQSRILTMEQEILNLQQEIVNLRKEIDQTLPQTIGQLEEEIGNLQEDADNLEANWKESVAEEAAQERGGQAGRSLKGILFGGVAGILAGLVLTSAWILLRYCLERKLRDADTLKQRYGYFVLGSLFRPSGRGNRLDRAIAKWAGYPYQEKDTDIGYRRIAAGLSVLGEKPGTVILVGTVCGKRLEAEAEALGIHLKNMGITLLAQPDAAISPEGLLRIKESHVIVAEEKDGSDIFAIDRQDEMLAAAGARVIGAILI